MFANLQVIVPTVLLQESCPPGRGKMPAKLRFELLEAGRKLLVCFSKVLKAPLKFQVLPGCYVGVVNDMYELAEFRMDSQTRSLRRARVSSH